MSEFINYLHEIYSDFGSINTHRMFGLVADDTLYLKVDESTKQEFIDKELTAFEYNKGSKIVQMSYSLTPEEIYDEPEKAVYWVRLAHQVALNSKTTRKKIH